MKYLLGSRTYPSTSPQGQKDGCADGPGLVPCSTSGVSTGALTPPESLRTSVEKTGSWGKTRVAKSEEKIVLSRQEKEVPYIFLPLRIKNVFCIFKFHSRSQKLLLKLNSILSPSLSPALLLVGLSVHVISSCRSLCPPAMSLHIPFSSQECFSQAPHLFCKHWFCKPFTSLAKHTPCLHSLTDSSLHEFIHEHLFYSIYCEVLRTREQSEQAPFLVKHIFFHDTWSWASQGPGLCLVHLCISRTCSVAPKKR